MLHDIKPDGTWSAGTGNGQGGQHLRALWFLPGCLSDLPSNWVRKPIRRAAGSC